MRQRLGERPLRQYWRQKSNPANNARQTLNVGDAWFGYGDYAKAAGFYRSALGRPGADPNLINLHLGMALALQGDKAAATEALGKVTGARADLAKYWLIYVNSKA